MLRQKCPRQGFELMRCKLVRAHSKRCTNKPIIKGPFLTRLQLLLQHLNTFGHPRKLLPSCHSGRQPPQAIMQNERNVSQRTYSFIVWPWYKQLFWFSMSRASFSSCCTCCAVDLCLSLLPHPTASWTYRSVSAQEEDGDRLYQHRPPNSFSSIGWILGAKMKIRRKLTGGHAI